MAGGRGRFEGRYRLCEAVPLLREVVAQGHEVGLHGSLSTWRNGAALAGERRALEDAIGVAVSGGRQHYLRFHAPGTWRAAAAAGLRYDASLGYPDAIGFRGGACAPYRAYDAIAEEAIPLWAIPLVAMDGTLEVGLGLSPQKAIAAVLAIGRRVAAHQGTLVLLWHNPSLYDPVHPGWRDALVAVVEGLRVLGGRPLRVIDAVKEWERREATIHGVASSG
jgi:peptidoglycan/xylan/chitin deacetylase (PgdA/CDA1 family)